MTTLEPLEASVSMDPVRMRLEAGLEPLEVLRWHLEHNLYPPLPDALGLCLEALEAMREGDEDRILTDEDLQVRAFQAVRILCLEAFL